MIPLFCFYTIIIIIIIIIIMLLLYLIRTSLIRNLHIQRKLDIKIVFEKRV
jgi:hypothetical protein